MLWRLRLIGCAFFDESFCLSPTVHEMRITVELTFNDTLQVKRICLAYFVDLEIKTRSTERTHRFKHL